MRLRSRDLFQTAHTEGGLLPPDLLQRVADGDRTLEGLSPPDYHLPPSERLNEAVTRSWSRLVGAWRAFDDARQGLPPGDPGGRLTRERWLHPLFDELGYGRLVQQPAIEIEGKSFPVFSQWQHTPIHLVGCGVKIDARTPGVKGAAGQSPHSLVQELLNRSPARMWGIVSNGLVLRVLRDSVALTRQSYLEFDLEAMFSGEIYPDFVLLWLVCHQSRVEADRPEDCLLERWTRAATNDGTRALDALREGVRDAIEILGAGFLAHPANHDLHAALRDGALEGREYYRQLLRLVYRLLFLFVAEDRDALLDPNAVPSARQRYLTYYSTRGLRTLAARRRGGRQHDRYEQLKLVMAALDSEGSPPLALPALGSYLWSREATGLLASCKLANDDLLGAIRSLSTVNEGVRRAVDFRNLGAEELGSVYESLLELHPTLDRSTATFTLDEITGSDRKTTGSYYTPTSLISSLLDSALEPVLDEAARADDPEAAILALAIVDPACGSGHFLIAAANRIAKRLAAIRSEDPEPSPDEVRAALRDVVGTCIHGVDLNPMAVELCKVSLWMEALEPGRPLSFLDHRIVLGNALLGTTPELIAAGIPAEAFKPILGDDKKTVAELRKRNAKELSGQLALDIAASTADADAHVIAAASAAIAAVDDSSLAGVREQQRRFEQLLGAPELRRAALAADVWSTAFVADKRPGAEAITQDTLVRALGAGSTSLSDAELEAVARARQGYAFLHWHVAFPAAWERGGFDVVLGNPPWERVKLQEKEFFAARSPEIANAPNKAARDGLIKALADDEHGGPELLAAFEATKREAEGASHFIRSSGRYPLCGRGDVNTYAVFAELMRNAVGQTGRAGVIVPTGIATDDTTKHFFRDLIKRRSLVSLFGFENEAFVFPQVHHDTKFCLLTLSGPPYAADPQFVFFARSVDDLADEWRRFALTQEDISRVNPNTGTCPAFRSERDAEVTKRVYERIPPLVIEHAEDGDPWGARFGTMFHMSADSALFETEPTDARLPLYEGKMFWQFDHRYGTYDGQTEAQANQGTLPPTTDAQHRDPCFRAQPRYWVDVSRVRAEAKRRRLGTWLIAYRRVTRAVNERTMIFTALPVVAAGDKAALVSLDCASTTERLAFLAIANSFVADYLCRQRVGSTSLDFFNLRQVAMPTPDHLRAACPWETGANYTDFMSPRVLELVYTAHDVDSVAKALQLSYGPLRWDEARRTLIRAELDAAMFHLYGIEPVDVDYILDTFPVVRRRDEQAFGEYRTKRLILERYDALGAAAASSVEYVSPLDPPPADATGAHLAAATPTV